MEDRNMRGDRNIQIYRNVEADSLLVSVRKLHVLIGPYSWAAKMKKCSEYAANAFNGGFFCNVVDSSVAPMPWEMNIFMALATIYADGPIDEIPDYIFRGIINTIRTEEPLRLYEEKPDIKDYIVSEIASIQIPYQQNQLFLPFRYKYLFSCVDNKLGIDMPKMFYSSFGVESDDIFLFTMMGHLATVTGQYWIKFIRNFCRKFGRRPNGLFRSVMELFSIDRVAFARRQQGFFELSTDGYRNAVNLLEVYPFVKMRGSYSLPLPYLLSIAAARHLFDRLMAIDENNRRKKCGPLMEQYVYDILAQSGCYDSVEREFKYRVKRSERLSPDVIVKKGDKYVFFEVKLSESPTDLRQMFPGVISGLRKASADRIYQLYSRIGELCNGCARHILNPSRNDVYGVVVLHEDSFLIRDEIYKECFRLHPEISDEDKVFIQERISITGLYAIEQFCYTRSNILDGLKLREDDPPYQISLNLHAEDVCEGKLHLPLDQYEELIRDIPRKFFDVA